MDTLSLVLILLVVYAAIIIAFLRFFGFLSDRDAEIRKLLASKRTRKKVRDSVTKRRLRLARS